MVIILIIFANHIKKCKYYYYGHKLLCYYQKAHGPLLDTCNSDVSKNCNWIFMPSLTRCIINNHRGFDAFISRSLFCHIFLSNARTVPLNFPWSRYRNNTPTSSHTRRIGSMSEFDRKSVCRNIDYIYIIIIFHRGCNNKHSINHANVK